MDRSSECISQGQEQRKPLEAIRDLELAMEMAENPGSLSRAEPVSQERLASVSLQTGSVHRLPWWSCHPSIHPSIMRPSPEPGSGVKHTFSL